MLCPQRERVDAEDDNIVMLEILVDLNFDEPFYRRLCLLADYYGTKPAWLCKRWLEAHVAVEEELIRYRHAPGREGSQGRGGEEPPQHHPVSPPHQEPPDE